MDKRKGYAFFEDTETFFDEYEVGPEAQASERKRERDKRKRLEEMREALTRRVVLKVVSLRLRLQGNLESPACGKCVPGACIFHSVKLSAVESTCVAANVLRRAQLGDWGDVVDLEATAARCITLFPPWPMEDAPDEPALDRYVWVGPDLREPVGKADQGKLYRITVDQEATVQDIADN